MTYIIAWVTGLDLEHSTDHYVIFSEEKDGKSPREQAQEKYDQLCGMDGNLSVNMAKVTASTEHYDLSDDDPDVINSEWSVEDVIHTASEDGKFLDRETAREILQQVFKNHDASVGINWEVIQTHIDIYCTANKIDLFPGIKNIDDGFVITDDDINDRHLPPNQRDELIREGYYHQFELQREDGSVVFRGLSNSPGSPRAYDEFAIDENEGITSVVYTKV